MQVINGQHAGEAGMLLQVTTTTGSEQCIIISDTSKAEIKVFAR